MHFYTLPAKLACFTEISKYVNTFDYTKILLWGVKFCNYKKINVCWYSLVSLYLFYLVVWRKHTNSIRFRAKPRLKGKHWKKQSTNYDQHYFISQIKKLHLLQLQRTWQWFSTFFLLARHNAVKKWGISKLRKYLERVTLTKVSQKLLFLSFLRQTWKNSCSSINRLRNTD